MKREENMERQEMFRETTALVGDLLRRSPESDQMLNLQFPTSRRVSSGSRVAWRVADPALRQLSSNVKNNSGSRIFPLGLWQQQKQSVFPDINTCNVGIIVGKEVATPTGDTPLISHTDTNNVHLMPGKLGTPKISDASSGNHSSEAGDILPPLMPIKPKAYEFRTTAGPSPVRRNVNVKIQQASPRQRLQAQNTLKRQTNMEDTSPADEDRVYVPLWELHGEQSFVERPVTPQQNQDDDAQTDSEEQADSTAVEIAESRSSGDSHEDSAHLSDSSFLEENHQLDVADWIQPLAKEEIENKSRDKQEKDRSKLGSKSNPNRSSPRILVRQNSVDYIPDEDNKPEHKLVTVSSHLDRDGGTSRNSNPSQQKPVSIKKVPPLTKRKHVRFTDILVEDTTRQNKTVNSSHKRDKAASPTIIIPVGEPDDKDDKSSEQPTTPMKHMSSLEQEENSNKTSSSPHCHSPAKQAFKDTIGAVSGSLMDCVETNTASLDSSLQNGLSGDASLQDGMVNCEQAVSSDERPEACCDIPPVLTTLHVCVICASGLHQELQTIREAIPDCRQRVSEAGYELDVTIMDITEMESWDPWIRHKVIQGQTEHLRQHGLGPFIYLMLGSKYGTVCPPLEIPAEDYDCFRSLCESQEVPNIDLIDSWYQKNDDSSKYLLKHPADMMVHYKMFPHEGDDELSQNSQMLWNQTKRQLTDCLQQLANMAYRQGMLEKAQSHKYHQSVLEVELNELLDKHHNSDFQAASRCLSFRVNDTEHVDLEDDEICEKLDILQGQGSKSVDVDKLSRLEYLHGVVSKIYQSTTYGAVLVNGDSEDAADMGCDISGDFNLFIGGALNQLESINEVRQTKIQVPYVLHTEMWAHQQNELLNPTAMDIECVNQIRDVILNPNLNHPIVISGSPSQRSQIISLVSQQVKEWLVPAPQVILRDIGQTFRSHSLLLLLQSLCSEICYKYAFDLAKVKAGNIIQTCTLFWTLLNEVSVRYGPEQPLVLILNSLEEAVMLDNSHSGYTWIPNQLPSNVYLVVSVDFSEKQSLQRILYQIGTEDTYIVIEEESNEDYATILNSQLDKAEQLFGQDVVTHIFHLLAASTYGLSKSELMAALNLKEPLGSLSKESIWDIFLCLQSYLSQQIIVGYDSGFIVYKLCDMSKALFSRRFNVDENMDQYLEAILTAIISTNEDTGISWCQEGHIMRKVYILLNALCLLHTHEAKEKFSRDTLFNFHWTIQNIHHLKDPGNQVILHELSHALPDVRILCSLITTLQTPLDKPRQAACEMLALLDRAQEEGTLIKYFMRSTQAWLDEQKELLLVPCSQTASLSTPANSPIIGALQIVEFLQDTQALLWGPDYGLQVWDLLQSKLVHHISSTKSRNDIQVCTETLKVYHTMDTCVLGWDLESGEQILNIDVLPNVSITGRMFNPMKDKVQFLTASAVSQNGKRLAIEINHYEMMVENKCVLLVDLDRGCVSQELHAAPLVQTQKKITFSRDATKLIIAQNVEAASSQIFIYECEAPQEHGSTEQIPCENEHDNSDHEMNRFSEGSVFHGPSIESKGTSDMTIDGISIDPSDTSETDFIAFSMDSQTTTAGCETVSSDSSTISYIKDDSTDNEAGDRGRPQSNEKSTDLNEKSDDLNENSTDLNEKSANINEKSTDLVEHEDTRESDPDGISEASDTKETSYEPNDTEPNTKTDCDVIKCPSPVVSLSVINSEEVIMMLPPNGIGLLWLSDSMFIYTEVKDQPSEILYRILKVFYLDNRDMWSVHLPLAKHSPVLLRRWSSELNKVEDVYIEQGGDIHFCKQVGQNESILIGYFQKVIIFNLLTQACTHVINFESEIRDGFTNNGILFVTFVDKTIMPWSIGDYALPFSYDQVDEFSIPEDEDEGLTETIKVITVPHGRQLAASSAYMQGVTHLVQIDGGNRLVAMVNGKLQLLDVAESTVHDVGPIKGCRLLDLKVITEEVEKLVALTDQDDCNILMIWPVADLKSNKTEMVNSDCTNWNFAANGKYLSMVSTAEDGTQKVVQIKEVTGHHTMREYSLDHQIPSCNYTLSNDSLYCVLWEHESPVIVYRLGEDGSTERWDVPVYGITRTVVTDDGLLIMADKHGVSVIKLSQLNDKKEENGHNELMQNIIRINSRLTEASITSLSLAPDHLRVVVTDKTGCLVLVDPHQLHKPIYFMGPNSKVTAFAISSDDSMLATSHSNGTIQLWIIGSDDQENSDLIHQEPQCVVRTHSSVHWLGFSQMDTMLVAWLDKHRGSHSRLVGLKCVRQ